jgi:tetratricopeptide (TPR) repeat protein
LRAQARYREAERYLRRAVKRARSAGPLEQAASNNALGMLFKYTGRHAEAARLYHEALDLLEAQLGARDRRLAPILHNMGGVEHARARYAAGEAHARRGLAIRRHALGRDHRAVACDEVALGALLEGQGKRAEAARLYRHALGVFEDVRGQPYEIAVTCNNLGTLAHAAGRSVEALALYRRSLRIKIRLLGERHPDVAITRNNLAALTAALGGRPAARALYARALAVLEHTYGSDHRLTRICRANLVGLQI